MLSLARILGLATYPLYLLHQIVGATIYMEPSIRTLLRRFSARTTDTILGAAASQRAALSDSVTLDRCRRNQISALPHFWVAIDSQFKDSCQAVGRDSALPIGTACVKFKEKFRNQIS